MPLKNKNQTPKADKTATRSEFADYFNHDPDAANYDQDVTRENHPIRSGYGKTLDWVVKQADINPGDRVLDLGIGTGNLSRLIPACRQLTGVDVSSNMIKLAKAKLTHLETVEYVRQDLLEFMSQATPGSFDAIISTYTIHHLTEAEKHQLFESIKTVLRSGGRAVFGDLMLESKQHKKLKQEQYTRAGMPDIALDLDDEFFWHLDTCLIKLRELGFKVKSARFSDLSFGIKVF